MELRDYANIFKRQARVFSTIVFLSVLAAIIWQKSQGQEYQATLLLNIGRTGVQNTQEYTYDSFYRLQADERFADTVVRWLGSPRVVEDIYTVANIDLEKKDIRDLKSVFGAKRLSSQMIEVTYADAGDKTLKKISEAVIVTLNRYTDSLNKENNETNWFIVIGSDPVVRDARIPFPLTLVMGLLLGVFVGLWAVLVKHYFQLTKNLPNGQAGS